MHRERCADFSPCYLRGLVGIMHAHVRGGVSKRFGKAWVGRSRKARWGLMSRTDQDTQVRGHAPRPPRKYVLLADGTGNAFTKQESNIWRLYEALDRTKPDQVACYIKGVGTASWAPFAALDG